MTNERERGGRRGDVEVPKFPTDRSVGHVFVRSARLGARAKNGEICRFVVSRQHISRARGRGSGRSRRGASRDVVRGRGGVAASSGESRGRGRAGAPDGAASRGDAPEARGCRESEQRGWLRDRDVPARARRGHRGRRRGAPPRARARARHPEQRRTARAPPPRSSRASRLPPKRRRTPRRARTERTSARPRARNIPPPRRARARATSTEDSAARPKNPRSVPCACRGSPQRASPSTSSDAWEEDASPPQPASPRPVDPAAASRRDPGSSRAPRRSAPHTRRSRRRVRVWSR